MSSRKEKKKVLVIGAGFSGLVSACYLAKVGYRVTIIDKLQEIGGRCRQLKGNKLTNELNNDFDKEFTFDMGPTWLWMPEVFNKFVSDFKDILEDCEIYETEEIKDSYQIFFDDTRHVMGSYEDVKQYFETLEPGAGLALERFMKENGEKYRIALDNYLSKPMVSLSEVLRFRMFYDLIKLDFLTSHADNIRKTFKHPKIRQIMEWPVIFLGSAPEKIPGFYGLLVYSAMSHGTHYPKKGMYSIIRTIDNILDKLGVEIILNTEIRSVKMCGSSIKYLKDQYGNKHTGDDFIAACDYYNFEKLLPESCRLYTDRYWDCREMSPSCLLFYLGFNRKLPNLLHHNMFFQNDLNKQIEAIYDNEKKGYLDDPVFYVSVSSKTDLTVIPDDGNEWENVYALFPLPAGIEQNNLKNEKLFGILIQMLEKETGIKNLEQYMVYRKTYCLDDFKRDYNAYKCNAYGLSNILSQTAFGKPSPKSPLIHNLFFSGQLSSPGPGVPPSIISGKNTAQLIIDKEYQGIIRFIMYFFYNVFFKITVWFIIFLNWCYKMY